MSIDDEIMSMGEEELIDLEARAEVFRGWQLRSIKEGVWTMKDGQTIRLDQMSDRHIQNCIWMLNDKDGEIPELWVKRFQKELDFRDYVRRIVMGELG